MSEKTFREAYPVYGQDDGGKWPLYYSPSDILGGIKAHGGVIVWKSEPQEPPPPAVCTCTPEYQDEFMAINDSTWNGEAIDFRKLGRWHDFSCPFATPF